MRYIVISLIIGAAVVAWLLLTPKPLRQGETAPSFVLPTMKGRLFDLDTYEGKTVSLVFFSPSDDDARTLFRDFRYVTDAYRSSPNVKFLAVAVDGTPQRVSMFMSQFNFPGEILCDMDHQLVDAYRLSSFPTVYVLDRELTVKYVVKGWKKDFVRELIPAIRRVAGK
ncbi:MAG: redoxin domain-containing protein [Bacteroidota bacterium]|nr:redoxin domain-containing protein [Bacteroidota bacterium]